MKIKKPIFFVQNLAHSMRYFFGPRGQNFWILVHGQNRGFIRGPKCMSILIKKWTHKICQNLGPASTISWKLKNPFFSSKISHTQWGTFLDPGVKIFEFWSMVKTGGSFGVQKCLSIGIDKRSKKRNNIPMKNRSVNSNREKQSVY